MAHSLARDGFCVFDRLVPADICDAIADFAARTPAIVEERSREISDRVMFNSAMPISRTYRIAEEDIVTSRAVQRLMGDESLLGIAETYLPISPILARIDLWWSAPYGNGPGTDAAQLFHFDFDAPPAWLKFFVYVTDVDADTGPHVFVRGSHRSGIPAAAALRARGYVRIPDEDIVAAYGQGSLVEICGRRGTIFAADTRGFHKGQAPVSGSRLVVQLLYASPPLSGAYQSLPALPRDIEPTLATALDRSPDVYDRFRLVRN